MPNHTSYKEPSLSFAGDAQFWLNPKMKSALRKLFKLILNPMEAGDGPYEYRPSHRIALVVMSLLFLGLGTAVVIVGELDPAYLLPVVVFGVVGLLGLIVGTLGTDRAVAKIWGSR